MQAIKSSARNAGKADSVRVRYPARIFIYCIILMFAIPSAAHAYIDPGAGTMLWQMLLAGFAGVLFYVGRFMARIRNKRKKSDEHEE